MMTSIARALKVSLLVSGVVMLSPPGFAVAELGQTVAKSGLSGSFLASRIAIDDNDDEAAVRFLERAVALDPDNATLLQDYFAALVSNGRVDEAAELVRQGKTDIPKNNLTQYALAVDGIRKRSWKKAEAAIKDVAGVDLDKALGQISLAWIAAGARDFDIAQDRINELDGPEWTQALKNYHSGLIAILAGDDELAFSRLQAVIDNRAVISVLTETYIRAIEAKIRLHDRLGDKDKAREALDYGLSLLPSHATFVRFDEALAKETTSANLVSSAQEGVGELFYNMASAIERDGVGQVAKAYYQIAHYLAPKSDVIKVGLAELYLRQRYYERSNIYYDQIGNQSPFERIARLEKANNLARLERKSEAIKALKKLVDEDPADLAGYVTLGGLFNREKRYREAADVYDRAVENLGDIQSHHWNLFFRRGIAYERLKEWDKAEPNFKKSLELSSNQPEVLNYLGYSWIDQGVNLDEGMEMIRKAVELRPRSGFIVDSLGWAYYRIGKFDDAVRELERAVELMPEDPTINDHLGDAYWKVGRKLEATFQWKIALAAKTEPENPDAIRRKLEVGLVDDKTDEAKAK